MIETLTYFCPDTEMLTTVNTVLPMLKDKIKSSIPQVEGLVVRPAIARQAKAISIKYRTRLLNSKFLHCLQVKSEGDTKKWVQLETEWQKS